MADFFIPAPNVERDFAERAKRYTYDDIVNAASLPLEGEAGWVVRDGNVTWAEDGVRTIPAERIRALRGEATAAGDADMSDLCTQALHGDLTALAACIAAVKAAEALTG